MARKSAVIQTQEELEGLWLDPNCPNMAWGFIETSMHDCMQEDGTYVATYDTMVIPEGETVSFTYLSDSGEVTYTLEAGEYGIRPSE